MLDQNIPFSHQKISEILTPGFNAIDCTCGNGNDTLFLAKKSHHVYGFDIQEPAIRNTKTLLESHHISNVSLYHESHENIDKYFFEKVKVIMFNLGYLPNEDHSITTTYASTLVAIKKSLDIIMPGGLISIVIYRGHAEGAIESNYIDSYLKTISRKNYNVLRYEFINKLNSPYLYLIEKV